MEFNWNCCSYLYNEAAVFSLGCFVIESTDGRIVSSPVSSATLLDCTGSLLFIVSSRAVLSTQSTVMLVSFVVVLWKGVIMKPTFEADCASLLRWFSLDWCVPICCFFCLLFLFACPWLFCCSLWWSWSFVSSLSGPFWASQASILT